MIIEARALAHMQCAFEITASGGHATLCTDATTKWAITTGQCLHLDFDQWYQEVRIVY